MKEGNNEVGRRVSRQNTKKGFKKQLGHPLTLEVLCMAKSSVNTSYRKKKKVQTHMGHPKP
jgi:hypothetical protein